MHSILYYSRSFFSLPVPYFGYYTQIWRNAKNENRINSLFHFQLINDNTRSTFNRNVHNKSMNYIYTKIFR